MNVEVYLVGTDEDDAMSKAPVFDLDQAVDLAKEEGHTVYAITARLDFDTIETIIDRFQP